MKVKNLIEYLQKIGLHDAEVEISIDISTGDEDAGRRVFSEEFLNDHIYDKSGVTLLFRGIIND